MLLLWCCRDGQFVQLGWSGLSESIVGGVVGRVCEVVVGKRRVGCQPFAFPAFQTG